MAARASAGKEMGAQVFAFTLSTAIAVRRGNVARKKSYHGNQQNAAYKPMFLVHTKKEGSVSSFKVPGNRKKSWATNIVEGFCGTFYAEMPNNVYF